MTVPDSYILLSENKKLHDKLKTKLQKNVACLNKLDEKLLISQSFSDSDDIEVVFDNDLLSFFEIIAIMERLKNKGFTFKIKPAGSDFIIGSNDSNDRGQVIVIN